MDIWEKGKTNEKVPHFVNFENPYRNDENCFFTANIGCGIQRSKKFPIFRNVGISSNGKGDFFKISKLNFLPISLFPSMKVV